MREMDTLSRDAPEVLGLIDAVRVYPAIANDLKATLALWPWPVPRTAFVVSERNFLYRVRRAQEQSGGPMDGQ